MVPSTMYKRFEAVVLRTYLWDHRFKVKAMVELSEQGAREGKDSTSMRDTRAVRGMSRRQKTNPYEEQCSISSCSTRQKNSEENHCCGTMSLFGDASRITRDEALYRLGTHS